MKKIIDYGNVWTCENMDNLSPIDWEGYKVLFSDGSIKVIDNLDEVSEYAVASEEEVKEFYRERNYLFIGDEVEIIKGKKFPIGEHKIVKYFYTYTVPGTYGHKETDYVVFEDGTKTNIVNVKNSKCKEPDCLAKQFDGGYILCGRI